MTLQQPVRTGTRCSQPAQGTITTTLEKNVKDNLAVGKVVLEFAIRKKEEYPMHDLATICAMNARAAEKFRAAQNQRADRAERELDKRGYRTERVSIDGWCIGIRFCDADGDLHGVVVLSPEHLLPVLQIIT